MTLADSHCKEFTSSIQNNLFYETDDTSRFIICRGFVIQYNCEKRTPNFTIHKIDKFQLGFNGNEKARRRSNFFTLSGKYCQSAENNDYKYSGYDRGHMVPAGDFYSNQLLKNETFILYNICPQIPQFNRGFWAFLEEQIRNFIIENDLEATIITGAFYTQSDSVVIGPNLVGIPSYFYKIIYCPTNNKMYAFFIDQNTSLINPQIEDFQVRVDDIENIVGEDFFDKLENELEDSLESSVFRFK